MDQKSSYREQAEAASDLPASGPLLGGSVTGRFSANSESSMGSTRSVFFNIGSVEQFERNLASIEDKLGVPMHERIPVEYKTPFDWLVKLLSIALHI
ncbi:unnamed protein product [Protopolystoma xenopodis]|uniref:Uncharacterized protein n=1 Tax=Protopolystoma xenopodis TaxID=117903 RepID=A0A3S5FF54_9PLAT|nr:unnamed protein product [Protopolystoma xenopodis]